MFNMIKPLHCSIQYRAMLDHIITEIDWLYISCFVLVFFSKKHSVYAGLISLLCSTSTLKYFWLLLLPIKTISIRAQSCTPSISRKIDDRKKMTILLIFLSTNSIPNFRMARKSLWSINHESGWSIMNLETDSQGIYEIIIEILWNFFLLLFWF